MLFIGRTMNKETQTGQRREREEKKRGNPRSCAYYSRNLTVITESALCKCARLRVPPPSHPRSSFSRPPKPSPNRLCARPQSPVLQKEASPVVVIYYWHENPRPFFCFRRCAAAPPKLLAEYEQSKNLPAWPRWLD